MLLLLIGSVITYLKKCSNKKKDSSTNFIMTEKIQEVQQEGKQAYQNICTVINTVAYDISILKQNSIDVMVRK